MCRPFSRRFLRVELQLARDLCLMRVELEQLAFWELLGLDVLIELVEIELLLSACHWGRLQTCLFVVRERTSLPIDHLLVFLRI